MREGGARESERERERERERQHVTSPHMQHEQWLRERGGACSLPEVGGGLKSRV